MEEGFDSVVKKSPSGANVKIEFLEVIASCLVLVQNLCRSTPEEACRMFERAFGLDCMTMPKATYVIQTKHIAKWFLEKGVDEEPDPFELRRKASEKIADLVLVRNGRFAERKKGFDELRELNIR